MVVFVTYLFLFLLGAVCGLIWLILFIIGCVKKSKKRIILSFIPVAFFAAVTGSIFVYDSVKRNDFEKIPCLEVNNDTVTILMNIHKGLNPNFHYVLAEEDEKGNIVVRNTERNTEKFIGNFFMTSDESILTETDNPFHMYHNMTKNGYTFKVNKPGTAYVCIFVHENGHYEFLEIYKVVSDDNMTVTADNIRHIECNDNFRNELPKEFSFLVEVYDELN